MSCMSNDIKKAKAEDGSLAHTATLHGASMGIFPFDSGYHQGSFVYPPFALLDRGSSTLLTGLNNDREKLAVNSIFEAEFGLSHIYETLLTLKNSETKDLLAFKDQQASNESELPPNITNLDGVFNNPQETFPQNVTFLVCCLFLQYLRIIKEKKCDKKLKYHFDNPTRSIRQIYEERSSARNKRLKGHGESTNDVQREKIYTKELITYINEVLAKYFAKYRDQECRRFNTENLSVDEIYGVLGEMIEYLYSLKSDEVNSIILYHVPPLSAMYDIADSFSLEMWGKYFLLETIVSCFVGKFSEHSKNFRRDFNQTLAFCKSANSVFKKDFQLEIDEDIKRLVTNTVCDMPIPLYFQHLLSSFGRKSSKQRKQIQQIAACAESLLRHFKVDISSAYRLDGETKLQYLINLMKSDKEMNATSFLAICQQGVANACRQYAVYYGSYNHHLTDFESRITLTSPRTTSESFKSLASKPPTKLLSSSFNVKLESNKRTSDELSEELSPFFKQQKKGRMMVPGYNGFLDEQFGLGKVKG